MFSIARTSNKGQETRKTMNIDQLFNGGGGEGGWEWKKWQAPICTSFPVHIRSTQDESLHSIHLKDHCNQEPIEDSGSKEKRYVRNVFEKVVTREESGRLTTLFPPHFQSIYTFLLQILYTQIGLKVRWIQLQYTGFTRRLWRHGKALKLQVPKSRYRDQRTQGKAKDA